MEKEQLIYKLRNLEPFEFEKFIASLWEEFGWDTTVRQESGDRGIDIIGVQKVPTLQKQAIQVKRYSEENVIGSNVVRQYATLYQQNKEIDSVAVVTTGGFTTEAQTLAEDLSVQLVDGDRLCELIEQQAPDLLKSLDASDIVSPSTNAAWKGLREKLIEEATWLSKQPEMGWVTLELWEDSSRGAIQIACAYDDPDTAPYETLREDVERIISVTDEGVQHSPRDEIRELLRSAGFEKGLTDKDNDRAIQYSKEGGSRPEAIESDVELLLDLMKNAFAVSPRDVSDIEAFTWSEYARADEA